MTTMQHTQAWDDVWAAFDARDISGTVVEATAALPAAPPPATLRLQRLIQQRRDQASPPRRSFLETGHSAWTEAAASARRAERRSPRSVWRPYLRGMAFAACAVVAVYVGSPVASAVQVAAAIQRGDAASLAHHIDWATLRPALTAALAAEAQANHTQPMPSFIMGMAQDMADRLASPAGLAVLLNERLAANGTQPAREMVSGVRMLDAALWEVTLSSPQSPERSARLTLALTDPMRLRWEVRAIELPARLPARGR